jgi:hypothetical protein
MTSTLALAMRLGELDDASLRAAVTGRGINPARIDDQFDLAEALLDAGSVQSALATLDRPTLAVLARIAEDGTTTPDAIGRAIGWADADQNTVDDAVRHLADLLLIVETDTGLAAYDAVRDRLVAWPSEGLPSAVELAQSPAPTALASVPFAEARFVDQRSAERAFGTVGAVSELLGELGREPARELQKGGLALPDARRMAAATGATDDEVPIVLWCAEHAGLAARDGSAWLATTGAARWAPLPTRDRWAALASGWLQAMSHDIRSLLSLRAHADWGDGLRAYASWLYPAAGPAMAQRIDLFTSAAELLGITVSRGPTRSGVALLEDGIDVAAAAMSERFPTEVDRVYLQHDLSVVSPGPLNPAIDARLRSIADVESRALASTYRVSSSSVTRAISAGETAASLREFLQSISLTGIPQPLDYLISETASRYGRVRVAPVEDDAAHHGVRTRVHSADAQLLEAIGIDQSLTSLGLTRADPSAQSNELHSRFERDVVFWALTDARYPVAAEDSDGRVVSLQRKRVAPQPRHRADDPVTAMLARLHEAEASDAAGTAEAWLSRQLDIAIRSRSTLVVTVGMPDGREVEYVLEPTGVGGGRVRGRDRDADIERTLPLSSIRGIRSA